MLRKKIQTRMLIALFIVMTFATAPLSALAQKTSPVAPGKAQVEAVVREAYERFKTDAGGKNADYIPYLAQVDSKLFGIDGRYQVRVFHPIDLEGLLAGAGDGRAWTRQGI